MTIKKTPLITIFIFILALIFVACSSKSDVSKTNESHQPAQQTADQQAPAKSASSNQTTFGSSADYLKALGSIVPQYPDSIVAFAIKNENKIHAQLHKSGGNIKNALAFYKQKISKNGWTLFEEIDFMGSKVLTFKKDNMDFMVKIGSIGDKALVITLAMSKSSS